MLSKLELYKIIFHSDTKAGKRFDVILLWCILASIVTAMLESIPSLNKNFSTSFYYIEWGFTLLFTIEYFLRIYASRNTFSYVFSFWGIIDLLAIIPTYLSFLDYGYHYLIVVRILRLLRVFRILKLIRFNEEAYFLGKAFKASSYKISIFFSVILTIVVILGTLMYVIEGDRYGFTSIPQSIYWAIMTITTVGYGDIVPGTAFGKFLSSLASLIGYAIIAVPTGIFTGEMLRNKEGKKTCLRCGHFCETDANYCSKCGEKFSS